MLFWVPLWSKKFYWKIRGLYHIVWNKFTSLWVFSELFSEIFFVRFLFDRKPFRSLFVAVWSPMNAPIARLVLKCFPRHFTIFGIWVCETLCIDFFIRSETVQTRIFCTIWISIPTPFALYIIHVGNYGTFWYIPNVVLVNFFGGARSAVWLWLFIFRVPTCSDFWFDCSVSIEEY